MNKRISLGAAITFMLIVATVTFVITYTSAVNIFNDKFTDLQERLDEFKKISEIDSEVRNKYYGTIDETQLMDSISKGYIEGLNDPYASYIDARTYDRLIRRQEGRIAGIGALLEGNADGYLVVRTVYPDSPAQNAGIEEGDLIVKIDDVDLTPENSYNMLESVQGETGTRITVTVRRENTDSLVEMTRRQVDVPSVHAGMIEDTDIGYIWIESFSDGTADQFNREYQRLINSDGARSLIFDVRDNSGGVLTQATRILDILLPNGVIASYTRTDGTTEVISSDANEVNIPMVVLVNSETASAAELFAVALRDYGKARIVGTNTMGKGVIQEVIQLTDGSAISITIAELMGPTGESFNVEGVKPDYEVYLEVGEDWRELHQLADAQLQRALEVAQALALNEEVQVPADAEEPSSEPEQISSEESSADEGASYGETSDSGDESSEESGESSEESGESEADE